MESRKIMPSHIWDYEGDLTSSELVVLLALVDYGQVAFPSQKKLAAKCRLSRSCINATVDSLREKGIVTTTGNGKSLRYRVNLSPNATDEGIDLSPNATGTCSITRQEMSHYATAPVVLRDRDPDSPKELVHPTKRGRKHKADQGGEGFEIITDIPEPTRRRSGRVPEPSDPAQAVAWGWAGTNPDDRTRALRWEPNQRTAEYRVDGDVAAQRRVTERELLRAGVDEQYLADAWAVLVQKWGETGTRPYEILKAMLDDMKGVRKVAAVILHRLGIERQAA